MQPAHTAEAAVLRDGSADHSYVEWAPIFAGAVLAVSVSLVLFAFASGVGLAVAGPWPGSGAGAETFSILSIAWILFVMIFSSIIGGYIAGRLRSPRAGASEDEVEFRDGAHGLIVWATGLILSALAAMALSLAVAAGTAAADDAAAAPQPYETSVLMRGAGENRDVVRAEIAPVALRLQAGDEVGEEDRAYLAGMLADNADISEGDARARVDAWITTTADRSDDARRAGAIGAFLLAATSLTAAAAAYFAAGLGGRHRDLNAPFPWTRRRTA